MKRLILGMALLSMACDPISNGNQPTHQESGRFILDVDPAAGTAVFRPAIDQTTSALHFQETGYTQDGVDGADPGTFDAVTTRARLPGVDGCGLIENCFDVHVNNATGHEFDELLMRIDGSIPATGHDPTNPDPLPADAAIGANLGVFNFGVIRTGFPSSTKDIRLAALSLQPYRVFGSWWARTNALFADNFEDGDISDWTAGSGYSVQEALRGTAAAGDFSLHMVGSSFHYAGLTQTLPDLQPTSISYYGRSSNVDSADGYFVVGGAAVSTSQMVFIYFRNDGTISVIGTTTLSMPYTPHTWYKFDITNIDWGAQTFDVSVDNNPLGTGVGFRRGPVPALQSVHLYNYTDSNSEAWWDEIKMMP